MKKVFKSGQKELRVFGIDSFGDVEKGEKKLDMSKLAESDIEMGSHTLSMNSFDDEVESGDSRVIRSKKSADEQIKQQEEEKKRLDEAEAEKKKAEAPPEPVIDEAKLKEAEKAGYNNGLDEGYKKGYKEAQEKFEKQYEAEKDDYMSGLGNTYSAAIEQAQAYSEAVAQLDDALPEMVIGFLEQIIGAERKLNDKVVISVIHNAMDKLKDLSGIIFRVNPEDAEQVSRHFPEHETVSDISIEKGGVKIETNIGKMDFTIKTMISNMEKHIYEELESSEDN